MENFIIYIIVFLVVLIFLYFLIPFHKREHRKLEVAGVNITFFNYLVEYYQMKFWGIPPYEIFKAVREAKELKLNIEIQPLKDLYKNVNKKFLEKLHKFNDGLLERELRIKRFWSHYFLGCSAEEFSRLIIESISDENPLRVKGSFHTESEMEKEEYINYIIDKIQANTENLPKLPPINNKRIGILGKIYYIIFGYPREIKDYNYSKFIANLKSELRDGKIILSKAKLAKKLDKFIFRDTYEAYYIALQSGLNITFRHIDIYLDKNVDIKKILELLNKLHEFDKSLNINELENFIALKMGENEHIILSLIHARRHGISINLQELWEYRLRGGDMNTMLEVLITAHHEGLILEIPQLTRQVSLKRDVEELVFGLIKLYQERIDLSKESGTSWQSNEPKTVIEQKEEALDILGEFQDIIKTIHEKSGKSVLVEMNGVVSDTSIKLKNIGQFVTNIIKASHLGLYFSFKGLKSFHANGGRIDKLMEVLIDAQQANLDITFDDCMQLLHSKGNIEDLLKALKICKRLNFDINKEQLLNLQKVGGDMVKFATACDLSNKLSLNVKPEEIEIDLIEGRNVLDIIFAIVYARNEGIKIDYHTAIKFDRIPNSNVPARIKWAVDPQLVYIEPVPITTKDGVEVKLEVNVTVRGKFMLYTQINRDEIFTKRVKEVLVKEVELCKTYVELVESLNIISNRLFLRLNAKMEKTEFPEMEVEAIEKFNALELKQNSISAFEILDINIPRLDIDSNLLHAIKRGQVEVEKIIGKTEAEKRRATAKALELEARAKLIESEAEINLGMAEAFRTGTMTAKDYLKKKIFDDHNSPKSYSNPTDE